MSVISGLISTIWANLGKQQQRADAVDPAPAEKPPVEAPAAALVPLDDPLDYVIGADDTPPGSVGRITEGPFDAPPTLHGVSIAYCNMLDQRKNRICGPYLTPKGTAKEYSEGVPDPKGPGFEKNLRMQFELRQKQGYIYVELDNPDDEHFSLKNVIFAIELAATYGLKVIAKNPGLLDDDNDSAWHYVGHPNVVGIIVEKGAGSPKEMDILRKRSGKPDLPVWFVWRLGNEAQARACAQAAKQFPRMRVTRSNARDENGEEIEYGNSLDVIAA